MGESCKARPFFLFGYLGRRAACSSSKCSRRSSTLHPKLVGVVVAKAMGSGLIEAALTALMIAIASSAEKPCIMIDLKLAFIDGLYSSEPFWKSCCTPV